MFHVPPIALEPSQVHQPLQFPTPHFPPLYNRDNNLYASRLNEDIWEGLRVVSGTKLGPDKQQRYSPKAWPPFSLISHIPHSAALDNTLVRPWANPEPVGIAHQQFARSVSKFLHVSCAIHSHGPGSTVLPRSPSNLDQPSQ